MYKNFRDTSNAKVAPNERLPNVVFVLGGPGAGKGTQCEKIVSEFGYVHLSAGELLRQERNQTDSKYCALIQKHITDGTIVPVEITCSLLEKAMMSHMSNETQPQDNFLVDGFPRNQDNMNGWLRQMGEKSRTRFVLFFDCDKQVCINRCLARGEAGSGRTDDNTESLQKRIVTYNECTRPIIEHFDKQGLVRRVDAASSVDEVFAKVRALFTADMPS